MKKILLTGLLCCATVGAFAQGVVQFRNYVAGSIDARVFLSDGVTALDGANATYGSLWRAALIGGPTTATPANVPGSHAGAGLTAAAGTLGLLFNPTTTSVTWVGFRTGTTPPAAPGYVNVGLQAAREVPTVNWGGQALVQLVAWQGNYTTWADAFTAWQAGTAGVLIGASNPLTLTLPTGPTSPTLTYLTGLQSFNIVSSVPEPTTFALVGLGAAALLIFRRRN